MLNRFFRRAGRLSLLGTILMAGLIMATQVQAKPQIAAYYNALYIRILLICRSMSCPKRFLPEVK